VTEGFSTLDVAPDERVDFWREMVRRHFVPLRIEPLADREFEGTVRLRSIGELDAARVCAHPMLAIRTRNHIERSPGDEYFVGVQLRGLAQAQQSGRAATLRPGDFALFDGARPYKIAFRAADAFDHLIVRIPHSLLDARAACLDCATAVTVKGGSAPGKLAMPALTTLVSLDGAAPFVDPVLDLIVMAVTATAGLGAPAVSRQQRALEEIKSYTLARLAIPDLTPGRVARACFVSPRQLHRLFEREGVTFSAFVKEARLQRVHRDLDDPGLVSLTIGEIGRRHGYRQASVLTRAFTERYGTGPRAFRQARLRGTTAPG
jgi:AraC-like DNA-binding protein